MRLIFLYVTHGAAPGVEWKPSKTASNFYSLRVREEGYFFLLKRMVEEKIVDEVVVVVESGLGQGFLNYDSRDINGWVIPDITKILSLINDRDIIWVRGGFKFWFTTLEEIRNNGNWMLLYAANTGRERWPIWDVVFNDLTGNNKVDSRGVLQFDFKKPTNSNIFFCEFAEPRYDLCIGASYIHDKKGQWRTVEALVKYKEIYGKHLKCIMPGAFRRGTKTPKMLETIDSSKVDISLPGMVPRTELCKILNRSKLFAHLGGGGQGDRGPIEAMKCGTQIVVGNRKRHSKQVYQNSDVSYVIPESAGPEFIARTLHSLVERYSEDLRKKVSCYYEEQMGVDMVILPEMKKLFDFFRENSKRDMGALSEHYGKEDK